MDLVPLSFFCGDVKEFAYKMFKYCITNMEERQRRVFGLGDHFQYQGQKGSWICARI